MNVKYQIFVSSTYEDLRDERNEVIKACLNMGHIPVGMEMFNAADWRKSAWTPLGRGCKGTAHRPLVGAWEKLDAPFNVGAELVPLGIFFKADEGSRRLDGLRHHGA
jgi:hypothetical protein